ncbi:UNVERIFIED_CONTAM: hypothetical protein K2H54_033503 [Gekko kuhli]
MDRKNEAALKKAHEALAIHSAAALSDFTRATAIWADNLLQNPEVSPLVLRRTLLKMKRVAEFTGDTSQDSIQFCAQAKAANIIRRNIWLKHWKVDTLSKSNLATEKFPSRLLFRESNLDKVLVEKQEKKKAMPSSSYHQERDTKTRPSHSFCAPYNAGRGHNTRDTPFKSFKYGMQKPPKHTSTYRPGKGPLPKKQVMVTLVAALRLEGIHMYSYLDDVLIRAEDYQTAVRNTQRARSFLCAHGFLINEEKSHTGSGAPGSTAEHISSQKTAHPGTNIRHALNGAAVVSTTTELGQDHQLPMAPVAGDNHRCEQERLGGTLRSPCHASQVVPQLRPLTA